MCLTAFLLSPTFLGGPPAGPHKGLIDAHHVVRGEAVLQGLARAIDAGEDLRRIDELDSPALNQRLRLPDLMLIDGHHGHLDEQRHRPFAQQLYPCQECLKRAGNPRNAFVSVPGGAVDGNLDTVVVERPDPVRSFRRDQRRIREERDQAALRRSISEHLPQIPAREDLPTRKREIEAPGLDQLVDHRPDLCGRQLVLGLMRRVIAVNAAKITAVGELDHGLDRDPLTGGLL